MILKVLFKSILFLIPFSTLLFSQKSDHVRLQKNIKSQSIDYSFQFKDHNNQLILWNWSIKKKQEEEMRQTFGFDQNLMQMKFTGKTQEEVEQKRKVFLDNLTIKINKGLFHISSYKKQGNTEFGEIRPDFEKAANYYKDFTLPIYLLLEDTFSSIYKKKSTWEERLSFLLAFIQDIPYGIPGNYHDQKYIGGVFSPPEIFLSGYGDCDSKLLLLASILSHYNDYEVAVIYQRDHALLGVHMSNPPENYNYITYNNKKYIFVESVGPSRISLGKMAFPKKPILGVEPIKLQRKIYKTLENNHRFIKKLGYQFEFHFLNQQSPITFQQFFVSEEKNFNYLFPVENMPIDNTYSYGSFQNEIYIHINENGYLIQKRFIIDNGLSKQIFELNFANAHSFSNLKPSSPYVIWKLIKNGNRMSYQGLNINSSSKGFIKAFLSPGKYTVKPKNIKLNLTDMDNLVTISP